MKKILSTVLVLVAFGATGLTLTAFCHHHDPADIGRMVTHHVEDLLDDVKATDAQRQQILALKDKLLADGKALHADHAQVRAELLALWKSDQPDPARVRAIVDGRADAMKQLADELADGVVQLHAILTPEQRATVAKRLERHMGE